MLILRNYENVKYSHNRKEGRKGGINKEQLEIKLG